MKMIVVDETKFEARVEDLDPYTCEKRLEELMPPMRICGFVYRIFDGKEFLIIHDDEFLYHGYNFTGICENGQEILMGSLLICATQDTQDDVVDDMGLRDLTDEEIDTILKAWKPVSAPLAGRYCKEVCPDCLFMMGSNALHYDW